MNVELVKPDTDVKGFERGERIIMVNGVRWGRTRIRFRGVHGQYHRFEQEGGEVLMVTPEPGARFAREIEVTSGGRSRHWNPQTDQRSTEERVLDKVKELIATGKLRDPAIVRAEVAERRHEMQQRELRRADEERTAFEAKAREALAVVDPIDRLAAVVEAMRWAQTR